LYILHLVYFLDISALIFLCFDAVSQLDDEN